MRWVGSDQQRTRLHMCEQMWPFSSEMKIANLIPSLGYFGASGRVLHYAPRVLVGGMGIAYEKLALLARPRACFFFYLRLVYILTVLW